MLHTGEEGLWDDFPSSRVLGRTSDPPSRDDGGGGYRRFRGILIGYLGFMYQGLLIGEEARQGVPGGPHHAQAQARLGRAWGGVATSWLPSVSYSGFVFP